MQETCLVCVLNPSGEKLLLAEKLRGLGKGKLNGPGGHIEEGEDAADAAVREVHEEFDIAIQKEDLEKVSEQLFHFMNGDSWNNTTFLAKHWVGQARASLDGEMGEPQWFNLSDLPFERMWADDVFWLPRVLRGERLKCEFWFDDKGTVLKHNIIAYG